MDLTEMNRHRSWLLKAAIDPDINKRIDQIGFQEPLSKGLPAHLTTKNRDESQRLSNFGKFFHRFLLI
jgi:hypothetical protein